MPVSTLCSVAIVYAHDGVRFVAAGLSRSALVSPLASYVMEQARLQLWPEDASRIEQLLSDGAPQGAIDLYFAAVGNRWDKEWLYAEDIDLAHHPLPDAFDVGRATGSAGGRGQAPRKRHRHQSP
jgi:hypothetical protein